MRCRYLTVFTPSRMRIHWADYVWNLTVGPRTMDGDRKRNERVEGRGCLISELQDVPGLGFIAHGQRHMYLLRILVE